MPEFRFENLMIWKHSKVVSSELFRIADQLQDLKYFRFAEQLRGATLSISSNIAEGSGSTSNKDFANFLNIAHRSVSEVANILIAINDQGLLDNETSGKLIEELDHLSRRIYCFRISLMK